MNKPQSLNLFLFPSADKQLGSVETPPLLRILRPASFGIWFIIFVAQAITVVGTGDTGNYLALALSTLLFAGVHLQFWYEESEQGARFHNTLERFRGRIYEDDITGLPNSRHFVFELRRQMMRSVRNGRGFALVFTDIVGIDPRKANDEKILSGLARNLRQAVGDGDFAARLEGSVFAAIVLDERERSAAEKSDDLLAALGAAIPVARAESLTPVVSVTGYEGELEVRDFLRRGQRDLQAARGRAAGPLYQDPGRVLGNVA